MKCERMKRLTFSGTGEAKTDVTIREILDKLKHYEDLEEHGRLIELPCKVGDTVCKRIPLRNGKNEIKEDVVDKIVIDKDGMFLVFHGLMKNINCIGDSLLLSKEDVKKKLKKA